MSATKPPLRQAQAADRQAIIVSHGQPSDPDIAEVELAHMTQGVRAQMPGWTVQSATLAAPGAIETALQNAGPSPLIYPLFMTDGWFVQHALPQRIETPGATVLPPLGVDVDLPGLARDWLTATLARQGWRPDQTCLIIAAHGSGRSRNSARDTALFAQRLTERMAFGDLRLGFIEEAPHLRDAAMDAGGHAVVLPFFATRRGHVLEDVPQALDAARFQGLCLDPIGSHGGVAGLIANALVRAAPDWGVA